MKKLINFINTHQINFLHLIIAIIICLAICVVCAVDLAYDISGAVATGFGLTTILVVVKEMIAGGTKAGFCLNNIIFGEIGIIIGIVLFSICI